MNQTKYKICKLNEVAWFQEGPGVRKSQFRTSGVKLLNVGNICDRELVLDKTSIYVSEEEAYGKYKHFLVDDGDLLIASSGIKVDYFDKKITFARKEHLPLCMNTSTIRFKVLDKTQLDIHYLRHFLASRYFTKQVQFYITGSAQLNFGPSHLNKMTIILPPLEEQKKIAKILDKADEIRQKKKRANDKQDEFLKSTFISMFGDPIKNEKGLSIVKVGELTTLVSSGSTPLGGSSVYQDEGILFIRSQNVLMNRFDFTDIAHISDEIYNSMARTQVQENDVLLNITGASIGRIHRYMLKDKANVNQHVCIIRPILDKVSPVYLEYCIGNPNYQYNILRQNSGATRQAFNFEQIKGFNIPLPNIEEQNKFATIVEKVEKQKQKNELVIEQMNNLFNSLSQRAFKGELAEENTVDLLTKQAVLHARIIDKCNSHQTFGSVKMEKIFNLCDMIEKLNLVPNGYYRKAAGPYVPEMRHSVEEKLTQNNWVKILNKGNGKKVEFKKDTKFAEYKNLYTEIFKDYEEQINKIIDYFYDKDTDYCEAFSTLYMCWNDLILEGKNPSKFEIIDEFKNHWAPEKQRFERIYLLEILSDMSNNNFEPHGQGLHTIDSKYNVNKNQLNLQLN